MKEIAVGEGNKDAAVRACLALASIRRDQGKEDEARDLINEAIKIDPGHEGLAEYLGEVLMVRCGLVDPKEYREISRTQVCGTTWCNPAYADGKLYLRVARGLFCVQLIP